MLRTDTRKLLYLHIHRFAYHAQQNDIPSYPKSAPHLPPKPLTSSQLPPSTTFNQPSIPLSPPLPRERPNQPMLPPKIPIVSGKGPELPPKPKMEDKEIHRTGPTTDGNVWL